MGVAHSFCYILLSSRISIVSCAAAEIPRFSCAPIPTGYAQFHAGIRYASGMMQVLRH